MSFYGSHIIDKRTQRRAFYLPHKETPEVHMMNQHNRFRCGTFPKMDCDALELPFANGYLKMYILLPKKLDGLVKLEDRISRGNLENVEDGLVEDIVDVFLPRFKYELGFTIGDKLQKVGIKTIFQPGKAKPLRINICPQFGIKPIFSSRVR